MPRCPGPEPGVQYAAVPSAEHRAASVSLACQSLARAWGITETRAADLLADPAAYGAEYRLRQSDGWSWHDQVALELSVNGAVSGRTARRVLELRYAEPWLSR